METPTDKQVEAYINSVPGLRKEWGILGAKRIARVCFAIMIICLIAIVAGAIYIMIFDESKLSMNEITGIAIVLVLTYVACGLRVFQLRFERAELVRYRKALAEKLVGNPATDADTQVRISDSFAWKKDHYRTVARMIGITGFIIITLNTYQSGELVLSRMLLFDGAIIAFLAGAFWNNFAFKAEALEVELEERSRATIKWQTEHPGEAQQIINEADHTDTADDLNSNVSEELPQGKHSKNN